jgi:hypothetical protein
MFLVKPTVSQAVISQTAAVAVLKSKLAVTAPLA